jgi:hypothetical protein
LDLSGDFGWEVLGIELSDASGSGLAGQYSAPGFFSRKTEAAKQTHAGHDYSAQLNHAAARPVSVPVPVPVVGVGGVNRLHALFLALSAPCQQTAWHADRSPYAYESIASGGASKIAESVRGPIPGIGLSLDPAGRKANRYGQFTLQ